MAFDRTATVVQTKKTYAKFGSMGRKMYTTSGWMCRLIGPYSKNIPSELPLSKLFFQRLSIRFAMAQQEVLQVESQQNLGETQIYEHNKEGQPTIFLNQMEDVQDTLQDGADTEVMKQDETPQVDSPTATTAAPADGQDGASPPASSGQGDDKTMEAAEDHPEGQSAAALASLQVAVVETRVPSDIDSEIEETTRICKQCGVAYPLLDMVERNPEQFVCKGCHCISTTLRRHLAWPPREFQSLSLEEQQNFWLEAARTKAAGDSMFRYERIRDVLRQRLVTRKINASKREVGGTYRPLSVLKKKGYILPEGFEATAPREWSEGLNDWTYLLAEITVNEGEVKESIEETLLECERQVKKRKVQGQVQQDQQPTAAAASASAPQPICFDLVSEDEEEKPKDDDLVNKGGGVAVWPVVKILQ